MDRTYTLKLDDQEVVLRVDKPSVTHRQESQRIRSLEFAKLLRAGVISRHELDKVVKERGIWTDEQEQEYKLLEEEVKNKVRALLTGGPFEQAKKLAFEIRKLRDKMTEMTGERIAWADYTVEGQADNAAFNYLVASCLVYNDSGKPFFTSVDEYLNTEHSELANWAATTLMARMYGVSGDAVKQLPENQFLLKYGLVNKDLKLVDEQGRLVDDDGRLIDNEGRFIDEENNLVNIFGHRVDEDGQLLFTADYTDENGNPVEPKS